MILGTFITLKIFSLEVINSCFVLIKKEGKSTNVNFLTRAKSFQKYTKTVTKFMYCVFMRNISTEKAKMLIKVLTNFVI